MKLGFVSAILPDRSLEQVVAFAAETGFECVELMCWPAGRADRKYAGVTHLDVTGLSAQRAKEIRDLFARHGISPSALGYYPNPLDPDPESARRATDHLKKVIRAAGRLEIGCVNTFAGRDWTRSVDENWPRFLKTFKPLVRLAEECGIRLAIENCPMYFTQDEWPSGKNLAYCPAIWRRMFQDIPSRSFGLNYDPSHLVWQQMDYLAPIREFADRIFHVHAKDVRVDRHRLNDVGILATPLEYHTPKLPGLGDVQWGSFFSVLSDAGYSGPVCVEVEDRAFEADHESRCAALKQSLAFLRNFAVRR